MREIGIGIVLGALRSNVIAMVMREVFLLIGFGLAAGVALALANLIRSQLYGLNTHDTLTCMGTAVVLASAAGLPVSSPRCEPAAWTRLPRLDVRRFTAEVAWGASYYRISRETKSLSIEAVLESAIWCHDIQQNCGVQTGVLARSLLISIC